MRTRVVLALCILLVPLSASAETRPGLEIGGSLVWVDDSRDGSDVRQFNSRADFNAAATVQFDATASWSLTTGLRYSRLGNEIRYENIRFAAAGAYTGTETIRQEYLGVPLFVQWNPTGDRGLFAFGGAEVAWLAKATADVGPNELPDQDTMIRPGKFPITDNLDRYNVVLVIGAGWEIPFRGHGLEIAARYGHGLTDFSKDPDLPPRPDNFPRIETPRRKTREFAVTLGFRW